MTYRGGKMIWKTKLLQNVRGQSDFGVIIPHVLCKRNSSMQYPCLLNRRYCFMKMLHWCSQNFTSSELSMIFRSKHPFLHLASFSIERSAQLSEGKKIKSGHPESNQRPSDFCRIYSQMLYQLSYSRSVLWTRMPSNSTHTFFNTDSSMWTGVWIHVSQSQWKLEWKSTGWYPLTPWSPLPLPCLLCFVGGCFGGVVWTWWLNVVFLRVSMHVCMCIHVRVYLCMCLCVCTCTCAFAQGTCLSFLWLAGVLLFSACCVFFWLGLLPAIFIFVNNILRLPCQLALSSVAVGNGKAMRLWRPKPNRMTSKTHPSSNPISPDPAIRTHLRH